MKKNFMGYRFYVILTVAYALFAIQEFANFILGNVDFSKIPLFLMVSLLSYQIYKLKDVK